MSTRNLENDINKNNAKNFYAAVANITDEKEMAYFLRDVFTLEELSEAIRRFEVARLLESGKTFRTIEKETGVSSATIARVNNWLHHGCGGYRIALKNVNK